MTFTTAAAAIESAQANLAAAHRALLAAADLENFAPGGDGVLHRRAGHLPAAHGSYTSSVDEAGASHVVETLPA
jgi:hypothetical protein